MLQYRILALIFRIFAFVQMSICLLLNMGYYQKHFDSHSLNFFTILSNIWVTIHFFILILLTIKDMIKHGNKGYTTVHKFFKGSMNLSITITHLVYHWMLVPDLRKTGKQISPYFEIQSYPDLSAHYFSCALALLDYLLFTPKNQYTLDDPFKWLLPFFLYTIYIFVRPFISDTNLVEHSRYPYFFVDIDKFGLQRVFIMMFQVLLLIVAIGFVFVLVDNISLLYSKLFSKPKEKKE